MIRYGIPNTLVNVPAPSIVAENGGFNIQIQPNVAQNIGINLQIEVAADLVRFFETYMFMTFPEGVRTIRTIAMGGDPTIMLRAKESNCDWDPRSNVTNSRTMTINACAVEMQLQQCIGPISELYNQMVTNGLVFESASGVAYLQNIAAIAVKAMQDGLIIVAIANNSLGTITGGGISANAPYFQADWLTYLQEQYALCDGKSLLQQMQEYAADYPWLDLDADGSTAPVFSNPAFTYTNGVLDYNDVITALETLFSQAPPPLQDAAGTGLLDGDGTYLRPVLLVSRDVRQACYNYWHRQEAGLGAVPRFFVERSVVLNGVEMRYLAYTGQGSEIPVIWEPAFNKYADRLLDNGLRLRPQYAVLTVARNLTIATGFPTIEGTVNTAFIIRRYGSDMPSKAGITEARAAGLVGAGIRDVYFVTAACSHVVTA
jgi:hypothetical protein